MPKWYLSLRLLRWIWWMQAFSLQFLDVAQGIFWYFFLYPSFGAPNVSPGCRFNSNMQLYVLYMSYIYPIYVLYMSYMFIQIIQYTHATKSTSVSSVWACQNERPWNSKWHILLKPHVFLEHVTVYSDIQYAYIYIYVYIYMYIYICIYIYIYQIQVLDIFPQMLYMTSAHQRTSIIWETFCSVHFYLSSKSVVRRVVGTMKGIR